MSARLDQSRARVQNLIGDTNPSDALIDPDALDEIIAKHVQLVAAECDMPMAWTEDAITLVAGTYAYDITAGEYRLIALGRLSSDGAPIYRVAPEVLEAQRRVPVGTGDPYLLAVLEQNAGTAGNPQKLSVLFYPTPAAADTVDLLISTTPALISTDAAALPLGELGVRAVECAAAAEVLARVTAEKLAARGIDKALGQALGIQRADAVRKERYRLRRLTASGCVGR